LFNDARIAGESVVCDALPKLKRETGSWSK
jgi:hypothetical protein